MEKVSKRGSVGKWRSCDELRDIERFLHRNTAFASGLPTV